MHRHPLKITRRLKGLGYSMIDYNDRSPHLGAMKARLRAYEEHRWTSSENPDANRGAGAIKRARSFIDLSHEYDNQARSNFASEAAAFAIITAIAVAWPMMYGVRLLVGS